MRFRFLHRNTLPASFRQKRCFIRIYRPFQQKYLWRYYSMGTGRKQKKTGNLPKENCRFFMVTPGRIELPITPWEGVVLAAWPRGHICKTAESRLLQDKKPSKTALYPEKQQNDCPAVFNGDPCENRTRDSAVKGRCLNLLTNGPFGSGSRIRTNDTAGMNRML